MSQVEAVLPQPDKLFLLEFLVDNIQINKTESLVCRLGTEANFLLGQTCVSFQFLHLPVIEITEEDFVPKIKVDNIIKFKNGKSCLFSVNEELLKNPADQLSVDIAVHRMLPPDILPDKAVIGETKVDLSNQFKAILCTITYNPTAETPVTKTLRDTFMLTNVAGKAVGEITLFIRLSCFGSLIVTQFQMDEENQQFLFKGNEGEAVYQCKELGVEGIPVDGIPSEGLGALLPYTMDEECQCMCPPVPCSFPYPCSSPEPVSLMDKDKDFEEISAEINGHAIAIRVAKKKKYKQATVTLREFASIEQIDGAPCILNRQNDGNRDRQITVEMPPTQQRQDVPSPYVSYKMGDSSGGTVTPGPPGPSGPPGCNKKMFKIEPQTGCGPSSGIVTDLPDPHTDTFLLRIGKSGNSPDKKAKLELELKTPKRNADQIKTTDTKDTQYDEADVGPVGKKSKKGKGGKGKKKKK